MNRWRVVGLVLLALLAAAAGLWHFFKPPPPPPAPPPPPPREVFHSSKPLRIEVVAPARGESTRTPWLQHELRHLLNRGRMRVAPVTADNAFTLRVAVTQDARQADVALVAPDQVVERQEQWPLSTDNALATFRTFAQRLPQFLGALPVGAADWVALIGTDEPKAYEAYLRDAFELLGPAGQGVTGAAQSQRERTVERLEALARRQPQFARARAALAIGYLSLGGRDQASLAQLAKTTAERALAIDDEIAEAHAALALVHMRAGAWVAARERFDRALALDANSAPALEGAGCLLLDVGQYEAARAPLEHAIELQPHNAGARECRAFLPDAGGDPAPGESLPVSVARVRALAAILAGNLERGRQLLRGSLTDDDFQEWAEPLLQAAADRNRIPTALQAITRAASDGRIDAATEILCAVALRRAEFVFNRMARLQREREPVALRILWMPQTAFLRRHGRFEQIVSAAGLPAFWQEYGVPDVCSTEPDIYACRVRPTSPAQ